MIIVVSYPFVRRRPTGGQRHYRSGQPRPTDRASAAFTRALRAACDYDYDDGDSYVIHAREGREGRWEKGGYVVYLSL